MAEQFSTDWDVEKYYDDTEPEEHWELRKAFMEVHKDKFPEDYLVALAKAFTNIEFLGCIYPAPLMVRIAELSKDVAKQYREVKMTKLQRTFVSGSNAAEQKRASRKSGPRKT
ncbi:XRN-Two Binding Domain, XTBD [Popillia japonica]|uniref:XRN-Two Binding Domain, XTBD n=1 Tax=Popillia japonica TaxID=7064 RepID=A0AAW1NJP2_POPJA